MVRRCPMERCRIRGGIGQLWPVVHCCVISNNCDGSDAGPDTLFDYDTKGTTATPETGGQRW